MGGHGHRMHDRNTGRGIAPRGHLRSLTTTSLLLVRLANSPPISAFSVVSSQVTHCYDWLSRLLLTGSTIFGGDEYTRFSASSRTPSRMAAASLPGLPCHPCPQTGRGVHYCSFPSRAPSSQAFHCAVAGAKAQICPLPIAGPSLNTPRLLY
jgi:hypothetical protein